MSSDYLVVATAGHIDHGKSALVQALTGTDPDRLKEEKARGITIELGFAHTVIGTTTVAFVDVPGHERFVKTMLAGVGGVDAVALIVAADESVMPQTREHFDICKLLQVSRGLVVVTKCDLVDHAMLAVVEEDVRQLVAGSFLEGAQVVAVSAKTGGGLDALRGALIGLSVRPRDVGDGGGDRNGERDVDGDRDAGAVRLPIDRVFSMTGFGTVVTGTLQGGTVRVDDELLILPAGHTARVRGLQMHGRPHQRVQGRHRVAVNLAGIDLADVTRGQTLVTPGVLTVTRRVDAEIDVLPSAHALRHAERVRFHSGTADVFGRVVLGADRREVAPGARALVRVRFRVPVAVTRGDRFILRSASHAMTVAGGRVLDPDPSLKTSRSVDAHTRLGLLAAPSIGDVAALAAMVAGRDAQAMTVDALTSRGGVDRTRLADVVTSLIDHHAVARAGEVLVASAVVTRLMTALVTLVEAFHRRDPLAEGLPREEARERLFARAAPAVFELVLARLRDDGILVVRDRLSLARHNPELSADDARIVDMLERIYRASGLAPPEPSTVALENALDPTAMRKMLELMVRQKQLVRAGGVIFHPAALAELRDSVKGLKPASGQPVTIDVGMFKQRYGVSRKFAIPLLEWLDRERVTRRVGDARIVL